MALPDPVTVAAAAPNPEIKLGVTAFPGFGSKRIDLNNGGYQSVINHTTLKSGVKHYVQLLLTKDATDPYGAVTKQVVASVSLTINRPAFGFTDTEMINLVKAHTDLIADSEVTVAKLLLNQS
uniref:Uncharacterized protein n=1 Tax=Leviviridae sp. TaxID=2027243 RepID=A0A514CYN0_9VIRU|nr:MAG: hypothetical protein H4Bulk46361_000002 [Leviviridae sp.]